MKKTIFFSVTSVIMLCIIFSSVQNTSVSTDGETNLNCLNNLCHGWGFKKTGSRPEFTKEQTDTMEKYNCIYMGNPKEKKLYLTFDEGYENGYTSIILDTLQKKKVPAAFFVTAPYVKTCPDLITRMIKEGHIVGNHTANHPSMPSLNSEDKIADELHELDRLVYGVCQKNCVYFRPPKGEYSERTLAVTNKLGYKTVLWSFAYVDWKNDVTAAQAEKAFFSDIHNGSVILLHAVSKGNADALESIIDRAQKSGYKFCSLDEYTS